MENRFIRAEDVAVELGVSKPYAYKLIRQLNEELRLWQQPAMMVRMWKCIRLPILRVQLPYRQPAVLIS